MTTDQILEAIAKIEDVDFILVDGTIRALGLLNKNHCPCCPLEVLLLKNGPPGPSPVSYHEAISLFNLSYSDFYDIIAAADDAFFHTPSIRGALLKACKLNEVSNT